MPTPLKEFTTRTQRFEVSGAKGYPVTYWYVLWQPIWNAEVSDFLGNLLTVAWFSHPDSCEILKMRCVNNPTYILT